MEIDWLEEELYLVKHQLINMLNGPIYHKVYMIADQWKKQSN